MRKQPWKEEGASFSTQPFKEAEDVEASLTVEASVVVASIAATPEVSSPSLTLNTFRSLARVPIMSNKQKRLARGGTFRIP